MWSATQSVETSTSSRPLIAASPFRGRRGRPGLLRKTPSIPGYTGRTHPAARRHGSSRGLNARRCGTVVPGSARGAGGRLAAVRSRLRFIIAISLAVVLGAWLAWTSLGGSLETYAGPGEIEAAHTDKTYRLNGRVAPGAPSDAAARAQSSRGLSFTVVDKQNAQQRVRVLYRGTVPDQFKVGREVVVTGNVEDGTFVAKNDSLITLCPSKFTDRPDDTST